MENIYISWIIPLSYPPLTGMGLVLGKKHAQLTTHMEATKALLTRKPEAVASSAITYCRARARAIV